MAVVSKIGAGSAFKVGLMVYALLGFLVGLLCSAVALAAPSAHAGFFPWAGHWGWLAVIVCPVVYALFGGITTLIAALLYNIASRWVGGVNVELQ